MSVPRTLARPPRTRRCDLSTTSGTLAALDTPAAPGAPPRRPVLLVPGFTGSKEDFTELLEPLSDAGHRVLAVDLSGQHESPGPEDADAYSLDGWAAEVADVVEGLGEPVHLLGHSFGGLVVQRAAPRLAGRLGSLTLLCTGPGALPPSPERDYATLRRALGSMPQEAVWAALRARQVARRGPAPAEVEEFLRTRFLRTTAGSLVAMTRVLAEAGDLAGPVAGLGLPVHVVTGELDDAWPPAVQERTAARLGARWTLLPGVGHSPNVEAPETLAAALTGFLAEAEEATGRSPDPR